jgi:hypothetical protein
MNSKSTKNDPWATIGLVIFLLFVLGVNGLTIYYIIDNISGILLYIGISFLFLLGLLVLSGIVVYLGKLFPRHDRS